MRRIAHRGALLLATLLLAPAAAGAQASPLLPPDHWAVEALRRVEALGLVPEYLAAESSVPRLVAGDVLRRAAEQAAAEGARWAPLVASWVERYREEFPEALDADDASGGARWLGGSAAARYVRATGRQGPGLGEFDPDRTGALPLPDLSEGRVGGEVAARLARPLAVSLSPVVGGEGAEVARWEADLAWRNWSLVVGRGEVGYGFAEGGGVLFSGSGALDRVEIVTARPFRFPGFLRGLGPVAFQGFVSRLPGERHPGEPVLTGVRLSGRVHPRVTLAGQRAALIGGSATGAPVDLKRLWQGLIGQYGGIENQIASVEVRLHLPTEAFLPATVYCEWGMEDTSGAMTAVPGILCGTLLPALPGVPELSAGVEYAHFGGRCCGNPPWYRHKNFPGSWALEEGPLGHPLGGEGSEWLAFARGSALDARLRVEARALRRERAGDNLFVPGREGDSFGAGGEAVWRFRPRSEVGVGAFRESGDGWAETRVTLGTRILF